MHWAIIALGVITVIPLVLYMLTECVCAMSCESSAACLLTSAWLSSTSPSFTLGNYHLSSPVKDSWKLMTIPVAG